LPSPSQIWREQRREGEDLESWILSSLSERAAEVGARERGRDRREGEIGGREWVPDLSPL